ncbi:hypothetical protein E2C01_055062 [Portunus trituberculatus]|uniref:Uncharacterized protein n=1 Tax=Portunus trituberculatus TaxID=210409 RepID=A0A5B7GTT9_PORTR|nr:hypothetical protein [Portunus trituberculatus]
MHSSDHSTPIPLLSTPLHPPYPHTRSLTHTLPSPSHTHRPRLPPQGSSSRLGGTWLSFPALCRASPVSWRPRDPCSPEGIPL